MDTQYRWCLDQADRDPSVRAIVITGTGKRFSVGGDSHAEQLASSVSAGALRASRHMTYVDLHRDVGGSVVDSVERLNQMMGGEEYREGVAALVEKRPPNF